MSLPDLTPEDVQLIANCGVLKTHPKNTVLLNEGDPNGTLYVILSGKVKIYVSDDAGREVILNIQGPNEIFGEIAVFDEFPRSASVATLEETCLSMVSKAAFKECITANPEIALRMIRSLCLRVRSLTDSVKDLALLQVYGRVIRTLNRLAVQQDEQKVIQARLTHQDIANMVGSSREMISRILKDLVTGSYIRIEHKRIFIDKPLPSKLKTMKRVTKLNKRPPKGQESRPDSP